MPVRFLSDPTELYAAVSLYQQHLRHKQGWERGDVGQDFAHHRRRWGFNGNNRRKSTGVTVSLEGSTGIERAYTRRETTLVIRT